MQVDLTASNTTICLGECVDLFTNVTGGDVSTYNYTLISVDNSLDVGVSIYPNPFSDKLYIKLEGVSDGLDYVVKMYDARGRLVIEKDINSNITIIDRKDISSGDYYLNISKGNQVIYFDNIIITNH